MLFFCGNVFAVILTIFTTLETWRKSFNASKLIPVCLCTRNKRKFTGCHNTTEKYYTNAEEMVM